MNLLVTGGAGFIGSHFVLRHAAEHPQDTVVVLDKLTYASDKSLLDPAIDRLTFVQGDIADAELVSTLIRTHSIATIVNFAAETHVDRSIQDASPFLHSNVFGIHSLIGACRENPSLLLLHISTDEVYGERKDDEPSCAVDDPLHPGNPYSASKAAGDLMLLAAVRTYGIRVRITRCTNNYGPHQDSSKLLPVVIGKALRDEKIPIYGKGKQKRDWLFVTDHTDAVECVLSRGEDGRVYLISADDERPNLETAKAVLAILGKPHSLIQFVPDRPGHDWRYALDSSSTASLGWKPQVSFQEGLKRTIDWYRTRWSA